MYADQSCAHQTLAQESRPKFKLNRVSGATLIEDEYGNIFEGALNLALLPGDNQHGDIESFDEETNTAKVSGTLPLFN